MKRIVAGSLFQHRVPVFGVVNTQSPNAALGDLPHRIGTLSAAWPVANLALFIPFELGFNKTLDSMIWYNGSVVSGNMDVGIYDEFGGYITSYGGIAQTGTSASQQVTIPSVALVRGVYYMGMSFDNAIATVQRFSMANWYQQILGIQQMSNAYPLPTTGAVFENPANTVVPFMAVNFRNVV